MPFNAMIFNYFTMYYPIKGKTIFYFFRGIENILTVKIILHQFAETYPYDHILVLKILSPKLGQFACMGHGRKIPPHHYLSEGFPLFFFINS